MAPIGFPLSLWLVRTVFPGARGTGVPQTVAALSMTAPGALARVMSLRIALGKLLVTLLGFASGASIGVQGPLVHISACVMYVAGGAKRLRPGWRSSLVLAGPAAAIGAAFNAPLGGIAYAMEELGRALPSRPFGAVVAAAIVAGAMVRGLVGQSAYFGQSAAALSLPAAVAAVVVCGMAGGLLGGAFSQVLIMLALGLPGLIGRLIARHPLPFASVCGLTVAAIGWASGGQTFGSGSAQVRAMIDGGSSLPAGYVVLRFAATVVSAGSGIPGGIFVPSMSIGAALGTALAPLVPAAPVGAMVLLGMAAYFAGVAQAPVTAAVIVMELTSNTGLTVPLLAAAFLARAVSRLVCPRPASQVLALRFQGLRD